MLVAILYIMFGGAITLLLIGARIEQIWKK